MTTGLAITRTAVLAGVGVERIRFYERRDMIKQPPRPRNGGFRSYDDAVVDCIRFIRQAQELGFSLREIKELLSLRGDMGADCGDVRKQSSEQARGGVPQDSAPAVRILLEEFCNGSGPLTVAR